MRAIGATERVDRTMVTDQERLSHPNQSLFNWSASNRPTIRMENTRTGNASRMSRMIEMIRSVQPRK